MTAGKHAHETYAFEAAVADYERALVWWDAVADPVVAAGVDRATVLLRAADAAREGGSLDRAGELAWSAIDEAFDLGVDRGVEAAGRAWTHLWNANRSDELSALAEKRVLPVLDRVEPQARARFLVGYVQHLAINATPKEIRGPATEMIATLDLVDDPVLEARGHMVNAWCHEAYGEFDRVEAEYVRAADLARHAEAHAMLVTVLANHAASKQWTPDFEGSIELLDAADELIERYGLSRVSRPRQRDAQRRVVPCGRARGGTRGRRCVRRAPPPRNRPLDAFDMHEPGSRWPVVTTTRP